MLEHGGRIARAVAHYGIPREQWLDLSTGVSPHAWPVPPIPADAWHRLPEDEDDLLDAARAYYGCEHLLAVAGTQAAIQALPKLRPRCRVGVLAPGYAEHAHAWRREGHDVALLPMADLLARAEDFDVRVFISPNNPTGERIPAGDHPVGAHPVSESFSRSATGPVAPGERRRSQGELLHERRWDIVDEAFADMQPYAFLQPREGLILLRSIGKFFGMAGARAGFVAAWPALLDALREQLGPWTLTGPTRFAVTQALRDTAWHRSARDRLHSESAALAATLARSGLPPSGGTDLFQYCLHPDATRLHEALARRGILTRLFTDPPALRLGLPPNDASLARLGSALRDILP
ncbi:threonine-phosphate decarboxylase [Luteibacter aegosomatissinici]|uniref:threonine-phosphate decarboxylase n=1 Tax=Luteibacter aegosomatissinici TaxID=2911539 RepID=UPI001FF766E9|nr:threonine-phosphate decarboxylase [Luteibacter aegosomatissinici]UPG94147.1 aminotransferase class I/II-fold pyridoxal phosphate-dependent enzyme [Luteibacter aegosomatissinici]